MSAPEGRIFVVAPSKVNLCLHVGDKQADGFHLVQSLVAFAGLDDAIWLEPAETLSLSVCGPRSNQIPCGEDNLVLKAARLIAQDSNCDKGASIVLKKWIPVASGLGGGSADAAAVMRGLVKLWNLDLPRKRLRELAAKIGADIPVCVDCVPAWMEGRGERVRRLPKLPDLWLLFVNPRVAVSTAEVFGALKERSGLSLMCPDAPFEGINALLEFLHSTRNDLEKPAAEIAPIIATVLDELRSLPEVLFARMSGSGATCYGIFANYSAAMAPIRALGESHPDWLIWGSALFSAEGAGSPTTVQ